jgi:simple sugar transport system permease protein
MEETTRVDTTSRRRAVWNALLIPALAIFTAVLIGAVLMLLTGYNPLEAYWGLFQGAFGSAQALSRTIRKATPFILTGLSVAFAFKAGLFNIGAAGQFLMGTIFAVAVGVNFDGLPFIIHLPLALLAGILGGVIWGAIPGFLKAWRGAHEVITTIMLNFVASNFASWTVYAGGTAGQRPGPLSDPEAAARAISETRDVFVSARIPFILPDFLDRVHWGFVIALVVAVFIWWLLFKTTIGFEVRTVGQNPDAARYAGIRVNWTIVMTMAIAGGLAGLAGAVETLGLNHKFAPEFTGSVGFEGITVALLGNTHPFGVVFAALFMGSLFAGAAKMQFDSGVRAEIIQVVQALVLMFVAAPEIIRLLYRLREPAPEEEMEEARVSTRWGKI